MCKSPALLGASAAMECYGNAWQTVYIECSGQFDEKCTASLSLDLDFCYTKADTNTLLIELWNKLEKK
jgi:hypothetical protein